MMDSADPLPRELSERFFDVAPCGFLITDADGHILRMNETLSRWLAIPASEKPKQGPIRGILDIPSRFYFETHVSPLLRMQDGVDQIALNLQTSDGRILPVLLNAKMIRLSVSGPPRMLFAFLNSMERREYERELVLANRRTEEALAATSATARMMERFAYFASHDLEAPLRKIRMHADILRLAIESGDVAERDHCTDVIVRSARQGSELIAALLRYSQARNSPFQAGMCQLDELLRNAIVESVDPLAEPAAVIDLQVGSLQAKGDPDLLRQVFLNLIGNSLKYHKPGHPPVLVIDLEERPADRLHRLRFRDEGIGFDNEHAQTIFEPLRRLAHTTRYPGTGIGLSLVQTVIERHGWTISAKGEPGVGATFTIEIPY